MNIVTVDFESHPIQPFRPQFPPDPVGLAIWEPGCGPEYLSWGHANGENNSTEAEARRRLETYWQDKSCQMLMHNASFDLSIAVERWGFQPLPWERVHDTLFLAFLVDPYGKQGLKPLAERHLGMPPEEQDAVADWVLAHKAELRERFPEYADIKIGKQSAGAWIFAAPAELVAPYAIGDVVRTRRLYDFLSPVVSKHAMTAAYDRERRLLPILMQNEREGIRVDVAWLREDTAGYQVAFARAENWLRDTLHASGLNFDADRDVASVLLQRGVVAEDDFTKTASGQLSVGKDALRPETFSDPLIASVLGYRNRLKTCLSMFMEPWLAQAEQLGGRISTHWNQTRAHGAGTVTGRPSTNNHNFLNISKSWMGKDDGYAHPDAMGLPVLPRCRQYLLPDEGHVWLRRDYSGQELRVFAHFEKGKLWRQYQNDPNLDVHTFVGKEMQAVAGRELERRSVKVLNFLSLYGGGVNALQTRLRCTRGEAQRLKLFHDKALPGRKILSDEIERVVRRKQPIRTAGGRLYFAPPVVKGQCPYYKLLNYLVQGSAADVTKQAIVDWYDHPARNARFVVQVYDEIDISAPVEDAARQMAVLRDCMEARRLTVPLPSEGESGLNWADMEHYDEAD